MPETLDAMRGALQGLMGVFQDADVAPTAQGAATVPQLTAASAALVTRWNAFKQDQLASINQQLRSAKLPEINPQPAANSRATSQNKDRDME
jgi:hypothetical protein